MTKNTGLGKHEIVVISEFYKGNYAVEISTVESGLWQAEIRIIHPESQHKVITKRGDLKTWRNLSDAIIFIQELCSDCQNITVIIGNWKFVRAI